MAMHLDYWRDVTERLATTIEEIELYNTAGPVGWARVHETSWPGQGYLQTLLAQRRQLARECHAWIEVRCPGVWPDADAGDGLLEPPVRQ